MILSIMKVILLSLFLCVFTTTVQSARILSIFHAPSKSHYFLGSKLLKELVARGHEVVSISPYPQDKPIANFTDVDIGEVLKVAEKERENVGGMFQAATDNPLKTLHLMHKVSLDLLDLILQLPAIQNILNSNQTFDLIFMEVFLNEAFLGIAHRFDCPVVYLATMGESMWSYDLSGAPAPYSYVPMKFLPFTQHMNFKERVINTLVNVLYDLYREMYCFPRQKEILHKHFKDAPDIWTLTNRIGAIFLNSHISIFYPTPRVPNTIDIGGFHVDKPQPLPKNMQEYLDNATEGAIYFSMGSNLRSSEFPQHIQDAILKAFSKLPYKILCKWENETLPDQPSNVWLGKWFPQQDILAHPNVKLFISHGGLLSTIEAVYHGVPIIGIPVLGDQHINLASAENNGYAIALSFNELTEENLYNAITKIFGDSKYKETVQKKSSLMKDQPVPPLELAMFWIEHVIRHRSGQHFRSAGLDLRRYQLLLLDVIAFLILVTVLPVVGVCLVVKKCFRQKSKVKKE